MFRKLLILGSIAALFTIMTAAPAFGLSVKTGQGVKTVLDVDDASMGESNPAHGPACGADLPPIQCDEGVSPNGTPAATNAPIESPVNESLEGITFNVGAWNAVFGPGGFRNTNSAICGIGDDVGTFDPENTCQLP